jgi:hypothetical protein
VSMTRDSDMDSLLDECMEVLHAKGTEYTVGSPDRLANFRLAANDLGLTMPQIWHVYFFKHYRAIVSYIKSGRTFSDEGIRGRIKDAIVYLLLFGKMVAELERKSPAEGLKASQTTTLSQPVT